MAFASLSFGLLPNPTLNPKRVSCSNALLVSRSTRRILPVNRPRRTQVHSTSNSESSGTEPVPEREKPDAGIEGSVSELEKSNPDISAIKATIAEGKKEKEGDLSWSGVAEEIREIEWPVFGRVLGTTGVVLAVIAGSSVALLTVNAVLAELSDRVFAGKGVQDFFG